MALVTRPEFLLEMVESAREHGRATMVNDMKLNAANRNKLKQHFWNQPLYGVVLLLIVQHQVRYQLNQT